MNLYKMLLGPFILFLVFQADATTSVLSSLMDEGSLFSSTHCLPGETTCSDGKVCRPLIEENLSRGATCFELVACKGSEQSVRAYCESRAKSENENADLSHCQKHSNLCVNKIDNCSIESSIGKECRYHNECASNLCLEATVSGGEVKRVCAPKHSCQLECKAIGETAGNKSCCPGLIKKDNGKCGAALSGAPTVPGEIVALKRPGGKCEVMIIDSTKQNASKVEQEANAQEVRSLYLSYKVMAMALEYGAWKEEWVHKESSFGANSLTNLRSFLFVNNVLFQAGEDLRTARDRGQREYLGEVKQLFIENADILKNSKQENRSELLQDSFSLMAQSSPARAYRFMAGLTRAESRKSLAMQEGTAEGYQKILQGKTGLEFLDLGSFSHNGSMTKNLCGKTGFQNRYCAKSCWKSEKEGHYIVDAFFKDKNSINSQGKKDLYQNNSYENLQALSFGPESDKDFSGRLIGKILLVAGSVAGTAAVLIALGALGPLGLIVGAALLVNAALLRSYQGSIKRFTLTESLSINLKKNLRRLTFDYLKEVPHEDILSVEEKKSLGRFIPLERYPGKLTSELYGMAGNAELQELVSTNPELAQKLLAEIVADFSWKLLHENGRNSTKRVSGSGAGGGLTDSYRVDVAASRFSSFQWGDSTPCQVHDHSVKSSSLILSESALLFLQGYSLADFQAKQLMAQCYDDLALALESGIASDTKIALDQGIGSRGSVAGTGEVIVESGEGEEVKEGAGVKDVIKIGGLSLTSAQEVGVKKLEAFSGSRDRSSGQGDLSQTSVKKRAARVKALTSKHNKKVLALRELAKKDPIVRYRAGRFNQSVRGSYASLGGQSLSAGVAAAAKLSAGKSGASAKRLSENARKNPAVMYKKAPGPRGSLAKQDWGLGGGQESFSQEDSKDSGQLKKQQQEILEESKREKKRYAGDDNDQIFEKVSKAYMRVGLPRLLERVRAPVIIDNE